jgi:hypothetical protein
LEQLLAEAPSKREKWVKDRTDRKLGDKVAKAARDATEMEDLHAALLPILDVAATPDLVPKGSMVLQPSEERRRSGSHYTPRSMTEPIVRTALEPILARLRGPNGELPRPELILDLKVCDPAMGSGAFLVEACRQLGDALVEAWHAHGAIPAIPPDEDAVVFARRLIAQRCLYGVDKNPVAVDLAKVSLWLATLAKDHALTFVDHALRHGDSLVGLSRAQIEALNWKSSTAILKGFVISRTFDRVAELRMRIRESEDGGTDAELHQLWSDAELEIRRVRLFGDLIVCAFFGATTQADRESTRNEYVNAVLSEQTDRYLAIVQERSLGERPLVPFHWEMEFPEVFQRDNAGFDAVMGNPPFLGGTMISTANSASYKEWLYESFVDSGDRMDLVAYFFRRGVWLLRQGGTLGFIATNTIAQGDTRRGGLRYIVRNGDTLYSAKRRVQWPGQAAVVVSVVHIARGAYSGKRFLDGREVGQLTAFLVDKGASDDPIQLVANTGHSFEGVKPAGQGFLFDDADTEANSVAELNALLKNPKNQQRIRPFISGDDVNDSPIHRPARFAIDFEDMSLSEVAAWPELLEIVRRKVKPYRDTVKRQAHRDRWWQYGEKRMAMRAAINGLQEVLVVARVSKQLAFTRIASSILPSEALVIFPFDAYFPFAVLQSRAHEAWARFFGSSLEDRLRYTPSTCFDTFPFPNGWEIHRKLEVVGRAYYDFRADLLVEKNEGLTKTYNRFHDPDERDQGILRLRDLHAAMDGSVLDAYGWKDIPTDCQFLLDYEIDEEEWGDKKKPWRYRWPDEVRDEVLARLLELNAKRAKEEAQAGATADKIGKRPGAKKKVGPSSANKDLFE